MADIPKLDLKSKDIAADKQQKLKKLFPEIFTEGDKIDFEKLRLTLGESIDSNDERFGLQWAGKKQCFNIIQEPSIGTLKPCKEESVNWDSTENLFIEGDNLEVLKQFQKSYYGKVKMIYIDPPYNTGKEFIYPDKYQENIDTYLAYTNQIDDEGYKFSTNPETEGRYHSNWLNMMYPRLFLARNLLKDDGVIFISIDDNESHNLKKICDEIFGEENFIKDISVINNFKGRSDDKYIATANEQLLIYKKSEFETSGVPLPNEYRKDYKLKDEGGNYRLLGLRKRGSNSRREDRPNMYYPIYVNPENATVSAEKSDNYNIVVYPKLSSGDDGCWRWGKTTLKKNLEYLAAKIVSGRNEYDVYQKDYLFKNGEEKTVKPKSFWMGTDFSSDNGTKAYKEVMGNIEYDYPKPTHLIKYALYQAAKQNEIVLDFFSGACSSAHAIMELNKDEAKNLKYIMVQLPEPTDEKKEANKQGYKTIADIGKERIRRVIKKINEEKKELKVNLDTKQAELQELQALKAKSPELFQNGKSNDLAKLESSIKKLQTKISNIDNTDLGFKVFKLDKSNFKIWDGSVDKDLKNQIQMAIDHIHPDSSEDEIFYEILLKAGFELTVPVKEITLGSKKVFSIEDDALLICLEKELTEDLIRAIAAKEPARVVCLDTGFRNNDQLKTNAVQIMKSHNVHDFRTV